MSDTDLHRKTATTLADLIRRGEIRSETLVRGQLDRIATHNPAINAITELRADAAVAEAEERDREAAAEQWRGPLHGVPITVKDSYDVAGLPSTFGLPALRDNVAAADSFVVERLKQAGAIVLGKSNVPPSLADWQSTNDIYGATRNPWDLSRTPGGSSGGAAAALAAGFSALEVGSDIGGSIRMPAHYCGVYGHKTSYGLIPGRGHAPPGQVTPSDITVYGPLARSAADLALVLPLLVGPDLSKETGWRLESAVAASRTADRRLAGTRIAVVTDDATFPVDRAISGAMEAVADFLTDVGSIVDREARPAFSSWESYETYLALLRGATSARSSNAEFARNLDEAAALDPADRSYRALMLRGLTLSHHQWHEYNRRRWTIIGAWEQFFTRFDFLLCPVASTTAFTLVSDTPKHARSVLVNGEPLPSANDYFWVGLPSVSYLPATVSPIAVAADGLPVAMQIIGRFGHDMDCLALATLIEDGFHRFVPPPAYC